MSLLILTILGISTTAQAGDLVIKQSVLSSTIESPLSTVPFTLTGYIPSVGYRKDVNNSFSVGFDVDPVIDFKSQDIIRTAVSGVVDWIVVGNPRRVRTEGDLANMTTYGGSAVAMTMHTSFNQYHVPIAGSDTKINGSNLQILLGMQGRKDFGRSMSFGVEALQTVISFSFSAERVTSSETQLGAFVRFDLD